MATTRPFAYNPSGTGITGASQFANLAVGDNSVDYSTNPGGVKWFMGPDEDPGYIVALAVTGGNYSTPTGANDGTVEFWRSDAKTDESFTAMANVLSNEFGGSGPFDSPTGAKLWMDSANLWSSWAPKNPYSQLQVIAEYLRGYMPDFRNPSFYPYQLDGDFYYISDGGGDMYDNGNISSPWVIAGTQYISADGYSPGTYPYAVSYGATAAAVDTDTSFGYISLGYEQFYFGAPQSLTYLPLTVLGARDNTTYGAGLPIGFQTGGNSGADGGGTLASGTIYNGETVNGFTVYAFYRETYNASDPSHCDLYILLGHTQWNSTFGTVNSFAQPVNQGGCGGYLYTSGAGTKNILAIKTLLSKNSGGLVTLSECQTVVDNFVLRVKQSQGF